MFRTKSNVEATTCLHHIVGSNVKNINQVVDEDCHGSVPLLTRACSLVLGTPDPGIFRNTECRDSYMPAWQTFMYKDRRPIWMSMSHLPFATSRRRSCINFFIRRCFNRRHHPCSAASFSPRWQLANSMLLPHDQMHRSQAATEE